MRKIGFALLLLACQHATADSERIYERSVNQPLDAVYDRIYRSLESVRFWVLFEANMGKALAANAKRWGDDYNRNKLEGLRSMMFCNPWYTNQVSNLYPKMLAFCPLSITFLHKEGTTTVLFERPSVAAGASKARDLIAEAESKVLGAIEEALSEATGP